MGGESFPVLCGLGGDMAADAMSSIEEMFCGIMWLLAVVKDELWYKRMLSRIEFMIF